MPTVTIIIPCRNERRSIGGLLDSILAQDCLLESNELIEWEAYVADGLSDDGTRELIDAYSARHPRIQRIDNPARTVPQGLNEAIRRSTGRIIVRMDAHTEYASDYVRTCVETLLRTGAQNVGGPARTKSHGFWQRAIAAAYRSKFACGGARFHDPGYEGYVDTVTYGCWRRETLERLGGFDEMLVRNQDDELNLRIVRAGGKIWQTPRIVSWYHPRSRLKDLFRQYFQYGFWKVAVIRKHRIPASWRHLVPVAWVLANLAFLLLAAAAFALGHRDLAVSMAIAWAGLLSMYLAASVAAGVISAQQEGWDLLPVLPLVYAVYHFSYGLGFLMGLAYWAMPGRRGASEARGLFTQLSR
jgi:glycosyltransferase involved in cell wall biosynthesis